MFTTRVYKRSPMAVKALLLNSRAMARKMVREGRGRRHDREVLSKNEYLEPKHLEHLQWDGLRRTLLHASTNVPFLRRRFEECGVDMARIQSPADIKQIPLLEKQDVIEAGTACKAVNVPWPHVVGSTSGTTGTPLTVWQDLRSVILENAFRWRQRRWAGYRPGERRAWIRGDLIVPGEKTEPPFWIRNSVDRMLMMSSYHLSERHAGDYIRALERFDPALIEAYPSSIGFLARFLHGTGTGYRGRSLKAIVTSSETLADPDRELIEQCFGVRVFDYYGAFERVVSIGTCEYGKYHLNSDYGFMEVGSEQEVIGTGFNNRLMPLVRYRLNDSVEFRTDDELCACGRTLPVVRNVSGRKDDIIRSPDGRRIGRLDHIYKGLSGVAAAQIVQERPQGVRILVEPLTGFDRRMESRLLANAKERLPGMEVQVERVARIERTATGKLRPVVSRMQE